MQQVHFLKLAHSRGHFAFNTRSDGCQALVLDATLLVHFLLVLDRLRDLRAHIGQVFETEVIVSPFIGKLRENLLLDGVDLHIEMDDASVFAERLAEHGGIG